MIVAKTLEEFFGQEHILGKDKLLYRTIKADRLSSIILWGPPGCGKTSLAKVISETTKYKFTKLNAVTSGVGDIKKAIETQDEEVKVEIKRTENVSEAIEALQILGYNKREIEKAFEKIANTDVSVEELIKKGLSLLARQ